MQVKAANNSVGSLSGKTGCPRSSQALPSQPC
ncbi:unnamed protein product [Nyctereutes procyonoides]|uniref:(raccoon dog) hypothetical protein n=1 Tax=Nyctereutes procyonoides TaxID=34880 RepID=A0A811Y7B0_NYCPR|nr:unnamed protein product [Nyctereutes procyonoides]